MHTLVRDAVFLLNAAGDSAGRGISIKHTVENEIILLIKKKQKN